MKKFLKSLEKSGGDFMSIVCGFNETYGEKVKNVISNL